VRFADLGRAENEDFPIAVAKNTSLKHMSKERRIELWCKQT